MAGKDDSATNPVLGRNSTGQKMVTGEEGSTNRTLDLCTGERSRGTDGEGTLERCTTEPIVVTGEHTILKRKAKEEMYPSPEQEKVSFPNPFARKSAIDEMVATAKLPMRADVTVAAPIQQVPRQEGTKTTEPMMVDPFLGQEIVKVVSDIQADPEIGEAVSDLQAEFEIEEADSDPQPEDQDGYDDEAEDDYGYEDEDEDDYDYESGYEDEDDWESEFLEQRPKVKAVLLNFPEAAKLEPHELDAAVERILEQSKPENASVAASGKVRLLSADIQAILARNRQPPIIHDLASKGTLYPADLIRRREELDKEFEKVQDDFEEFQAKVRTDLIEKGYTEVDEDYYDNRDKFDDGLQDRLQEEWNKIDFSRFYIAKNDKGIAYYSEEHGCYI
ncbi:hypothetical protein VPH35_130161 [Triticum aestivum]